MAVNIMDTLQPAGNFPIADAKHISIESASGDTLNLREFLLSTPEVGDDITVEVAREASADGTYRVAIGLSARSRLPGGCSVLLSWRNSANVLVATVSQSGITGHSTVVTNLPIGLYSYTLAISNPNGTETRTGEVAVGSITFSTPAFDAAFSSSFFTANTAQRLLLSGTVATAYNTSAVRAIVKTVRADTNAPVDTLSADNEVYTAELAIEIPSSAVAAGKNINFRDLGFYFKPVSLSAGEYSVNYRLSIQMLAEEITDGITVEHLSDPVNYETAVMTASTVVLIHENASVASLSNLRATRVPVKMLTSSNTIRASGTRVVCSFYDETGKLLGATYPTVLLHHGALTEVPVVTPNTLTQSLSNLTLKIEPHNLSGIENIQTITFTGIDFKFEESSYAIDVSNIVADFNFTSISGDKNEITEKTFVCENQLIPAGEEYKLVLSAPAKYDQAAASAKDDSVVTYLNINPNTYAALYRKPANGDWVEWDPVKQILDITQVGGLTIELGFKSFENDCVLTGNGLNITSTTANVNFAANLSAAMIEGEWHHLLISYDATDESYDEANGVTIPKLKASIYLDGVLVAGHKSGYTPGEGTPLYLNYDGKSASTASLGLQYLRIHSKAFTNDSACTNFLASGTIKQAEEEEKKSKLTKVYFISDYSGEGYTAIPNEFYKKVPMYETSFSVLNNITEKTPDGKNIVVASKNTFVPCTIAYSYIDAQNEEHIEIWAKGISGAFSDPDDLIPVARLFLQGTSTLRYPIKNYQTKLSRKQKPPTIAEEDISWIADKVYTLKCDFMEQSHRNNTPTACFYQDNIIPAIAEGKIGSSSKNDGTALSPASAVKEVDTNGETYRKYRDAINGFPVEVYFVDTRSIRDKLCDDNGEPSIDRYKEFISTNLAAFTAIGSYMFNVDKEGKQLGFCIDTDDTKVTIEDVEASSVSFERLNLPEDNKLNFRAITKTNDEGEKYVTYALKGNCTAVDVAKGEYTAFGTSIKTDGEAPIENEDCSLSWQFTSKEYKLHITCDYLPCVSYEGATNENSAAAAFVPYSARWARYLSLCWEKGTAIEGSDKKTFQYRATHTPEQGTTKVYTTAVDDQTGNEVYVASGTSCQPVTFAEFVDAIESETYKAYSASNDIDSAEGVLIGQKLALVLSEPEYEDEQGSDEIGYLEATLDPRFSFTDDIDISFVEVSDNTQTKADIKSILGSDAEDSIENYFKFGPIKRAIDWVYARYNEIFSTDPEIATAGENKFKEEFKNYFSLEYCLAYYLQMMVFAQVDNAGKNAMYDTWGDGRLYPRPYDMDTQVGLNNRGQDNVLTYAEMSMDTSPIFKNFAATSISNWVETSQRRSGDRFSFYNTSESALWKSFYKAYKAEICSTYFTQRVSGGIYDINTIMNAIDSMTSSRISKATYNLDAVNKFFDTSKQSNLHCIAGSRRDRYYNYMIERLNFLDTLFYAYSTEGAANSISTIVTPSANSYFAFAAKHPQYVYVNLDTKRFAAVLLRPEDTYEQQDGSKAKGVRVSFSTADASTAQNKNTDIYCCKYLTKLDGLTSFSSIDKLDMTNLENITELDLSNTAIKELSISPSLIKLDISQSSATSALGYEGELDLSNCTNLQEVIATNATKLTGIKLPADAPIRRLELANTGITSLKLTRLTQLTTDNIDISGCKNLSEISITGCSNVYSVAEMPFGMPSTLTKCTITECPKFIYLDLQGRRLNSLILDSSIHTLKLASCTFTDMPELNLSSCTNLTYLQANDIFISNGDCTLLLPKAQYYADVEFPKVNKLVYSLSRPTAATSQWTFDTLSVESLDTYGNWTAMPSDYPSTSSLRNTYTKYTASGIFSYFNISQSKFSAISTASTAELGVYDFSNIPFGFFRTGDYKINNTPMQVVKNLNYQGSLNNLFLACRELQTIDDSCTLRQVGNSIAGMFQTCPSLTSVNIANILDEDSRELVTNANYLFWGTSALPFNTVTEIVNSFPKVEQMAQALRGALSGQESVNLDRLFGYTGTARIHTNLQDISMLFYDTTITRLTGTLPPSITNIDSMCCYGDLKYVSRNILSGCHSLVTAANTFYGCQIGTDLTAEELATCIVSGNDKDNLIFHENARNNTLTNIRGLFASNAALVKTGAISEILGVCSKVIYADGLFLSCKKVNITSNSESNGRIFDALPNVYFADNMLRNSGMTNFPTDLGVAEKLVSARGLLANIHFTGETSNVMIPSNWLSSSLKNLRFIGTSGNIADASSATDSSVMFKSFAAEAALGESVLPAGYSRVTAHRLGAGDSWEQDVTPGILAGSYLADSATLYIPVDVLSGLSSLIDCAAAFASYKLSNASTLNINANLGYSFYVPQELDSPAGIIMIPASVKSCAYCFAGISCQIADDKMPLIFSTVSNVNNTLENIAGLFYRANFTNLTPGALFKRVLGEDSEHLIRYSKLRSIENIFSEINFANAVEFDISGYRLLMPVLRSAVALFRKLPVVTGTLSNLFFESCRSTLVSVKHAFNGTGIEQISTGSYTSVETTKYALLTRDGTGWKFDTAKNSYMRTWWNNHWCAFQKGLVDNLQLDTTNRLVSTSANVLIGSLITENRNAVDDGFIIPPQGTAAKEIYALGVNPSLAPKNLEPSEDELLSTWFKVVYDLASGVYRWATVTKDEVINFLSKNGLNWFASAAFSEVTTGILIAGDRDTESGFSTVRNLSETDLCAELYTVLTAGADESIKNTVYVDLVTKENFITYEAHLKSKTECNATESGILGDCANLSDASFCFANCKNLTGAIPADCLFGSKNLLNISALFAFNIKMLGDTSPAQELRVNNQTVALNNTGAGSASTVYPQMRTLYDADLVAAGICPLEAVPTSMTDGTTGFYDGYLVPEDFIKGATKIQNISGLFMATGVQSLSDLINSQSNSLGIAKLMFSDKTFSSLRALTNAQKAFMLLQSLYDVRIGQETDIFNAAAATLENMNSIFAGASVKSLKFLKPNTTYTKLKVIKNATNRINWFRAVASGYVEADGDTEQIGYPNYWAEDTGLADINKRVNAIASFKTASRFPNMPITTGNDNINWALAGFFSESDWRDYEQMLRNDYGIIRNMCDETNRDTEWNTWISSGSNWTEDVTLATLDSTYNRTILTAKNL